MRAALLATVAVLCLASEARAGVIYTLVNPVYDAFTQSTRASLTLRFAVSDAAVARGSFNIQGSGLGRDFVAYTGDVADFMSFTANEFVTPDYLYGRLSLSATFSSTGTVTSFSENYYGAMEMSSISGSGAQLQGTFGSDNFGCGISNCRLVSGQFTQAATVPEPFSLGILATGLLAGLAARRRGLQTS